jgi:hypothetical protein
VYKQLTRITQKTRKYDLRMLKDNNINTVYTFYINGKLIINLPFPNDTIEDKWYKIKNVIHEAASNTLKKNLPEPKKQWINGIIIRHI